MPVDLTLNTRATNFLSTVLPFSFINTMAEKQASRNLDHTRYGLKPDHRLLSQHPAVNDDLPNRVLSGSVIIKPNIQKILKTGVEFEDGTVEENIDTIIFATGYLFGFPFIDSKVITVKENQVDLYKYMFPPDLAHPSLAVIGCIQPWGAIMPISEMQCRLATRLWKVTWTVISVMLTKRLLSKLEHNFMLQLYCLCIIKQRFVCLCVPIYVYICIHISVCVCTGLNKSVYSRSYS